MKKLAVAMVLLSSGVIAAQDIPASQVPSLVTNSFKQQFADASDVEWEKEGENYKVEFDTGFFTDDHEAWYDKSGKLLRHEEEISGKELPEAVMATIKARYAGYKIDDVDKITENGKATYKVELDKYQSPDIDVVFDEGGQLISINH